MKNILFIFLSINLTACASFENLFKSDEQFRAEYQQKENSRLASLTPEQRNAEQIKKEAMDDCVRQANIYGGSIHNGHTTVYNSCMYKKGY